MGNQTAYDIFGFASAMMVPVGMGIQSAVAANSSVMRAVGTTLAKQGLTMAAGYGTDKAGEALGLPPELRMLMSMGAMTVAGYGVEALDTRFNVSGYHVTSKMPQFGFSDYMDSEDAASYNKHWDDLASGKHLPPGMDADDLARYNLGLQKVDENLALSKIDAEALAKLRAQEAARLNALDNGNFKGVPDVVDVNLKYKKNWTPEQIAEADAKVKALSEGATIKTPVDRSGTSARAIYKKVYGENSIPEGYDVDHVIDLQLGGSKTLDNFALLDRSVNRSLGKQIETVISQYPNGTKFGNFTFK